MQVVESNVSRRRLLRSALTLGAGAAIGSTMSFPSLDVPLAAAGGRNLVHDELIRQLEEGVRAMRGDRPGEAARAVAGTLQLLAAHFRSTGVEARFRRNLRTAIARDGRDAVLRWEVDAAMLAAEEARGFGVTMPLPHQPFNLLERERALDGLLRNGSTPVLLAAAAEIARRASQLERGGLTPIAARQCTGTGGMLLTVEFATAASCLIDSTLRAGFTWALLGLKLSLYFAGC